MLRDIMILVPTMMHAWAEHTQEDTDHTRAGRPALELAYSFKLPRRRPGREPVTSGRATSTANCRRFNI
jgi:hypothetical protein